MSENQSLSDDFPIKSNSFLQYRWPNGERKFLGASAFAILRLDPKTLEFRRAQSRHPCFDTRFSKTSKKNPNELGFFVFFLFFKVVYCIWKGGGLYHSKMAN